MQPTLSRLVAGQTLDEATMVEVFDRIMSGQASPAQIGALLAMLQMRGPTVPEITGAARVMRQKVLPVTVPEGLTTVDTCGTGGDRAGTFNVSTAAALITAAAGRPRGVAVAKHGNRSVTSQSGSSQVLETLGVRLQVTPETLTACLDEIGFCFCFAPAHHPAMKHAMPIRMDLGFRTVFNILGPLTNPAGAMRQVMGVFDPAMTLPIAQVLQNLGADHAMVVHGMNSDDGPGGIDEFITWGVTHVSHLRDNTIEDHDIRPEDAGLATASFDEVRDRIVVDSPEGSAAVVRGVLAGDAGPARDLVCLNAAAALVTADLASDLREGVTLAEQAIDSGSAAKTLEKLIQRTNAD